MNTKPKIIINYEHPTKGDCFVTTDDPHRAMLDVWGLDARRVNIYVRFDADTSNCDELEAKLEALLGITTL
jgi:hypothetical protein